MALVRISLLYISILTSINTVFVSSLLHSSNNCDVFSPPVRYLCNKIENLWTSDGSTVHQNNYGVDTTDKRPRALVLGNIAINEKRKSQGCSMGKCKTCPDATKCTKCRYGYFLQFDSDTENNICVRKCHPGYRRHVDKNGNALCQRVSPGCNIMKCLDCIDSHTCSVCKRGYYPQFNANSEKIICVKKCFIGYALNEDYRGKISCKEMPPPVGCSDYQCTSCRRGYYMQPSKTGGALCTRHCPKGYIKDRIRRRCAYWKL